MHVHTKSCDSHVTTSDIGSSSVLPITSVYISPLCLSPELVDLINAGCVSSLKCVSVPVSVNSPCTQ